MTGYLKGRLRREDIITAAIEAYRETGYHGSSLREVAKRAGITHAGLLYYFPTKEALLAAVLERRDAEDAEREKLDIPPGMELLRHLIALAEYNVAHRGIVEVYARLAAEAVAPDHPAHEYFIRHYQIARDSAVATFTALAESGELRDGVDPHAAAVAFIGMEDGLQVQWLTTPDEVDLVGSMRFFLRNLLTVPLD
ncbi:TetR/AcrR family transcriptional regulator [Kibdelosporangium phytohabitans]|uniref:TetR family transcriptional regulator n=1 Tax=Kibdelosporangium phytohabitans TaxID=860235 RepID=A0A0N9HR31_9PSEU|nr:TetR family transcriptional regulator [Kibdelosporangium phytohabitans]ALG09640.1 TetR family transcriptional regulator [Kibdelosporangium phytohabitans]MBE1469017.1 AcrR family transcriptional regulator [Kibdelosporangium phytohabitans]